MTRPPQNTPFRATEQRLGICVAMAGASNDDPFSVTFLAPNGQLITIDLPLDGWVPYAPSGDFAAWVVEAIEIELQEIAAGAAGEALERTK